MRLTGPRFETSSENPHQQTESRDARTGRDLQMRLKWGSEGSFCVRDKEKLQYWDSSDGDSSEGDFSGGDCSSDDSSDGVPFEEDSAGVSCSDESSSDGNYSDEDSLCGDCFDRGSSDQSPCDEDFSDENFCSDADLPERDFNNNM